MIFLKFSYDLHIHTALSPCGDKDMTPNNIVNMSLIKELDIIAITDHNTCGNVKAVMEAAEGTGLLIIPGMEIETSEAIHIICLFKDIESAIEVEKIVLKSLPIIKNKKEIFGEQILFNKKDEVIGEQEQLLVTSTNISIYEMVRIVKEAGGAAIPAHVDRQSYSVISNLGTIPKDLKISTIEISQSIKIETLLHEHTYLDKYNIIQSSDAHYLQDIAESIRFLDICNKSIASIIDYLR